MEDIVILLLLYKTINYININVTIIIKIKLNSFKMLSHINVMLFTILPLPKFMSLIS